MSAPDHAAAATPRAASRTVGVLAVGDARVALPIEALREVLPCPAALASLPARAPGLAGATSVRGRTLPVVDLGALLGDAPRGARAGAVVAVVRHADRTIGVLADGVAGLASLPAHGCDPMDATDARLLFAGSFVRTDDGSVVSLLDAGALTSLPGVPVVRGDGAPSASRVAPAGERRALMLVRCGRTALAVDVADVHTTLPRVALQPSALDGPTCRGRVEHAGLLVPAVDPLALLGLGALPADGPLQALVVRCERGLVALLVTSVVDLVAVPRDELRALPPLLVREPGTFDATLRIEGVGEHLVFAPGALAAHPRLRALATLNAPARGGGEGVGRDASAGRDGTAGGTATAGVRVLTFDIGVEGATLLDQVEDVLPFPAEHADVGCGAHGVLGLHTARGVPMTLVCLAAVSGGLRPDDVAQARVLHVEVDGRHVGFAVRRLLRIDAARWRGTLSTRGAGGDGDRRTVVEVGDDAQRRTLRLFDLRAIARAMIASAGVDGRVAGATDVVGAAAPGPDAPTLSPMPAGASAPAA